MIGLKEIQKLQQFKNLEFIARQVVEGFITGMHKSPLHGFSVEFAEHRLYNTGESTKHIDWKLYGKTDKFFVKRFEEETNLRCQLVIDNSSSMYFPFSEKTGDFVNSKIYFSVYCAAAIIYILQKQRDAYGLSVFSDKVTIHTQAKTNSIHQKFIYNELSKLLNIEKPPFNQITFASNALHQIADSIHKRSLVIIFSDMMSGDDDIEKLFSSLQHLKHNKHEVILFHVVDKQKEFDFEYENKLYKFIDMETGKELLLHPSEIRQHYVQSIKDYHKNLKLKCGQYNIDFVEADINQGFEQILQHYLVKRSMLY
ncbi:MAG: hypothetical protein AUJ97_07595 [Bacteroidetes bacterium CG2_30_32_10]|nr:MAG: hypothetical protein AUJ97_07595 [Bacteroidetes bacterium CG2_30_32_10]